jgi:uncharacterized protein
MPDTIDWPLRGKPRGSRRVFLVLIFVFALIVLGGRAAISCWVDLLWFRSLAFGSVFWKTWELEWGTFAVFAALTFLILYGAIAALKRAHSAELPDSYTIFLAGHPIALPVGKRCTWPQLPLRC